MDNIGQKVTSGIFWNYSERILAQLVSLIVSIVLARLIAPDHFGAIAIVSVLITLCNVFVSNGFGNALIQAEGADSTVFNAIYYFSLIVALGIYVIIYIAAPYIASFYNMPILEPVIRVMGIRLPIASLNTVQHAYLVRRLEFKKFFLTTLSGTVISAVVGITMAYMEFEIWALVAQYLTNVTIDTILLFFTCGWRPTLKADWKNGVKLLPFGIKVLGTALVANIYDEISDLLIGKKFSVSSLAYYTKGKQFPSIIVTNINSSISRVLFSAMAKYQSDIVRVKGMIRRSIKINIFVIAPVMIGMTVCAESIIRIVLSEKWIGSTIFLRVFCAMFFFRSLCNTIAQGFNAIGKSGIIFKIQITSTIFGLISLTFSAFVLKSVIAVALSTCLVQIIALVISIMQCKKVFGYSLMEFWIDVFPLVVINSSMAVITLGVGKIPISTELVQLLLQVVAGVVTYVGIAVLLKNDSLKYIISTAKPFLLKFKRK